MSTHFNKETVIDEIHKALSVLDLEVEDHAKVKELAMGIQKKCSPLFLGLPFVNIIQALLIVTAATTSMVQTDCTDCGECKENTDENPVH